MTPEEKDLMNQIAEKVEENNNMLHRLQSAARWNSFWRWVYWILIIGSSIGAFYVIQPYLDSLADTYGSAKDSLGTAKGLLDSLRQ